MVRKMGVSNWYLYVGIFLACTGVLLIPGVIMVVYWFYKHFMDNGIKIRNEGQEYQKQIDKIDQQIERVDEYERKYLKSAPQQDYIEEKKLEGWR
jgi:hypothetical protein